MHMGVHGRADNVRVVDGMQINAKGALFPQRCRLFFSGKEKQHADDEIVMYKKWPSKIRMGMVILGKVKEELAV
jgi:hypothetical protein